MTTWKRAKNLTRKALTFVFYGLGADKFSKNIAYLRNRVSLPIFRDNLQRFKAANSYLELETFETDVLIKSAKAHLVLMLIMSPIFMYSLVVFSRGMGALIRFSTFTMWLPYGFLLSVITLSYLIKSRIARRNTLAVIAARAIENAKNEH